MILINFDLISCLNVFSLDEVQDLLGRYWVSLHSRGFKTSKSRTLTLPGWGFQKLAQTGGGGDSAPPLNFAPLYSK